MKKLSIMRILWSLIFSLILFNIAHSQIDNSGYTILETKLPIISVRTQNQTIMNDPKIEAKLVEKDTVGDDLTGGYIIRIDKGEHDGVNGWYSNFRPNFATKVVLV